MTVRELVVSLPAAELQAFEAVNLKERAEEDKALLVGHTQLTAVRLTVVRAREVSSKGVETSEGGVPFGSAKNPGVERPEGRHRPWRSRTLSE
jgi:hypothetical protein